MTLVSVTSTNDYIRRPWTATLPLLRKKCFPVYLTIDDADMKLAIGAGPARPLTAWRLCAGDSHTPSLTPSDLISYGAPTGWYKAFVNAPSEDASDGEDFLDNVNA